jgi:hypothetical protein
MKEYRKHPSRKQLIAFVRGQSSASALEGIANHIEGCDSCCRMLREIPDGSFLKRIRGVSPSTNWDEFELAGMVGSHQHS